jgi:hypothetical protein
VRSLRAIVESAAPYGAWLALIVAAYIAAYLIDPYIYGVTVLGLGAVSSVVAGIGLVVWSVSRQPATGRRMPAIGWLSLAIAAVTLAAIAILETFRWA